MTGEGLLPLPGPHRCGSPRRCRAPVIWPGVHCGRCAHRARLHGPIPPANPPDAPWVDDPAAGPLTLADIDLLIGERRRKEELWVLDRDVGRASLPGLDGEAVNRLARNGSLGVRRAVARRPGLTGETIRFLTLDYDDSVRRDLAANPHLDPAELWWQARHGGWNAQAGVAANPAAPPTLLWWLAAWPATLDLPNPAWAHLAVNPHTPAGLVAELVKAGITNAAGNPNCPPGVLAGVAADPNPGSRVRAARHHATPPDVLVVLAADPDNAVRQAALENPGCLQAGRAAAGLVAG